MNNRCPSYGVHSLKNCHNPFGQGFWPPLFGQCPNIHVFTVGFPFHISLIKSVCNFRRTTVADEQWACKVDSLMPTDDEEEEMIVNKFNHHKQHYFGDFLKKNLLYLSTWSTLRFLNETVKRLKKMQTWAEFQQRSAAVRNSLCEPGRGVYISLSVFFQYLFVRIYRGRKNTKVGKPVANFSSPDKRSKALQVHGQHIYPSIIQAWSQNLFEDIFQNRS